MRLDKYLAHANLGSRKEVKQLVRKGKIKVNGIVCKNDDIKIDPDYDIVEFEGFEIEYIDEIFIMMNKPIDCVSANSDTLYTTVFDYIDINIPKNCFVVGRLDVDTTGLLIISNNGEIAHKILSPKNHVKKIYEVTLNDNITKEQINKLESGVKYEDEQFNPAKVTVINDNVIHLEIYEGKFHQVKKMMMAVNNPLVQLKRIQMGNLILDDKLQLGEFKILNEDDILKLQGY